MGKGRNRCAVESGFNLVTGDGRAEIEFEVNSTAYLAPNAVLMFDTLTPTDSAPHSVLKLLSGSLTLHVKTLFPSRDFQVSTPNDLIRLTYPKK
ncbi:FecR domain-containing protein [Granulicella tundricola]|uniref:Putative chromosome segregation ATPase n=1 Tax=Granulicella tundricola (strain ATCC BAA-1859 / DSM 23138 / MP5ACTX9) TaxID=1198114 RepID=E8X6G6_GRATM|nr:FecR domain-containing protein [Granulicella tundricola]ADW71050.1 putative chromosome segregation ATPase [Granulicella tundricola MP5ACTX9]